MSRCWWRCSSRTIAGFVLANGSMSSSQSGEGEIRKNLIEADLVDCMVALPGQLFYSTQIPACLWFLARRRSRRGEVLFIDAGWSQETERDSPDGRSVVEFHFFEANVADLVVRENVGDVLPGGLRRFLHVHVEVRASSAISGSYSATVAAQPGHLLHSRTLRDSHVRPAVIIGFARVFSVAAVSRAAQRATASFRHP